MGQGMRENRKSGIHNGVLLSKEKKASRVGRGGCREIDGNSDGDGDIEV
jgi:hypothetical protein